MKKIILKSTGKEIKVGDVVFIERKQTLFNGSMTVCNTESVVVSDTSIPYLVKQGIIEVVDNTKEENTPDTPKAPTDIIFYMKKIGDKLCMPEFKDVDKFLGEISKVSPAAAFSILLKEIAVELDKQYSDHIQNSQQIFVVSTMDGRISEVNKAHIKNYRNFAAFRSIDDARIACKILRPILKSMFKSE